MTTESATGTRNFTMGPAYQLSRCSPTGMPDPNRPGCFAGFWLVCRQLGSYVVSDEPLSPDESSVLSPVWSTDLIPVDGCCSKRPDTLRQSAYCAVEHPMLIALHEAATKRAPSEIQPLQNPDPSHQNHQDTDEAADHSHHRVECTTHRAPRDKKVCVHLPREHIRKALNSGLLSMLMRLPYISVG